jgi:DNA polymerase III sliding clamp (beta) subunit (PCNA family)
MPCLGVLFSLDKDTILKLKAFSTDDKRLEFVQEEIEASYFDNFPQRMAELVQSWDALHRSLTDGKLTYTNGTFPLNHVIMGGEIIYNADNYIMTLKTPEQVKEIATEVIKIDKDNLKQRYYNIDEVDYEFPLTEEDFEFTWEWFDLSKEFWKLASEENRFVLFTVDQ